MMIDIHADDYALTLNTSKDMLECMRSGKLNSISIVPNMSCFDECMEMLYSAIPSLPFLPLMSVHINLVEGICLADKDKGTHLGFQWKQLFLYSYFTSSGSPVRRKIKSEIAAQIEKCMKAVNECLEIAAANNIKCGQKSLRIDSHQHTHHLPIVWTAITEVLAEGKYDVEYIRNSREPLAVFLSKPELYRTYRPVNAVKNRILYLYSFKIDKYCRKNNLNRMYLWGLLMSGKMDFPRIRKLKAAMKKRAFNDGRDLEILFHPGTALENEINDELDEAAVTFYRNGNRRIEKESVGLLH